MDYDLQRILPHIAFRQLYLARCFIQKGLPNSPHVIWSSFVTYLASYNSPYISNGMSLCHLVNMPGGSNLRKSEQTEKTKHFSEARYNAKHDKNASSFYTCRNAQIHVYIYDALAIISNQSRTVAYVNVLRRGRCYGNMSYSECWACKFMLWEHPPINKWNQ